MDLKLHHCFLAVDDHDKAIGFYHDVLGFEVRQDVKAEGMRWVTVGPKAQPDIHIVLETPVCNPNASPSDRLAIAELMAKGMFGRLDFATEDVDSLFEQVRDCGVEVMQEPMDQPYGARDFAVRDPAGNMLRFSQPRRRP